jgi:hypothetical protein
MPTCSCTCVKYYTYSWLKLLKLSQFNNLEGGTIKNLADSKHCLKVARHSYHKNPAQESRTKSDDHFTRRSRKLINKMKELTSKMTWPDVFYSVLCQLLTSLEFSILEKQMRYISLFCLVTYVQILHAVLHC